MNKIGNYHLRLLLSAFVAVLLLTGCIAGQSSFKKGNQAAEARNYDQAVFEYLAAVESDPGSSEYRMKLDQARNKAALVHKAAADALFGQKQYAAALQEYQLSAELDNSMFSAVDGLKRTQKYLQVEQLVEDAEGLLQSNHSSRAEEVIRQALSLVPDYQDALLLKSRIKQSQFALIDGVELEVTSTNPIDLNFRETKLPDVFEILTKLSGINFILDEDIRNTKTTLFLEQATFAQSLELLLRMNKLDKKILNSKTIILYPKTRDKQKQFKDQVIQTFYLSHFDAKKAVNMLRTMLQVRKIYVQEDLNAIVIRDQPEVIKLAQKLIEANDRGDSEVVFDLELIEVNHSDTRDLGLKLSNYSIGAGLSLLESGRIVDTALSTQTGNLIPLVGDIHPFKDLDSFYTMPNATFRFMKTLVDAEILASPKIRVKNKEKAKVHIGSREPIITVTTNDGVTSDNVQYIDIGVKLDVEPNIHLDNTVVVKIGLEVSNVSGRETTSSGTAVITISSTNANTTLTLKDGEQTIIGGLIRNDKSTTKNTIPLLGDIPLLGEIFTGTDKTKIKREILLSITPHIVKSVHVPRGDLASIWSGGEDDLKFGRNFGTFVDEYKAGQQGMEPQVEGVKQETLTLKQSETKPAVKPVKDQPREKPEPAEKLESPVESSVVEEKVTEQQLFQSGKKSLVFIEGPNDLKQADLLSLSIQVEQAKNLHSAPMTIQYDADVLEFIGTKEGSFLSAGGAATVFTPTSIAKKGKLIVGLKLAEREHGASGKGELFSIQFKVLMPGETGVRAVQTNFRNGEGEFIATENFEYMVKIAP